jgi:hypothetical protein
MGKTAISPSPSELARCPDPGAGPAPGALPPFVVFGNPGDVRLDLFQGALRDRGLPPARVIAYRDLLAGRADLAADLANRIAPGSLVRIDSPGRDAEVERALLAQGADLAAAEGSPVVGRTALDRLAPDKGRILHPRQWYLGFRSVLEKIERSLAGHATFTSQPADIAVMFDKHLCHQRLQAAGIRVPAALPAVRGSEELRVLMREAGLPRVFVKLRHGASASGVVALETGPGREQAWTTVEMAPDGTLYNSRRLRRYEGTAAVSALIDALAPHGVHTEAWIPKAGVDGGSCDLRVVTVLGRPALAVLRVSRGPLTNLHLLNRRADPALLRARMPPAAWEALLDSCRRVAAQFPRTLHTGIDVAVRVGFRDHAVLEVNAFGDLLHGVTRDGRDTYATELAALLGEPVATAGEPCSTPAP